MSRARAARKPVLGEMVATTRVKFARVSARKARDLADLIRGLTVAEARQQLAFTHRPSAMPVVERALLSVVANARVKEVEADPETLVVGEIFVDGGPILKRFRPAPMGRAVHIRKRSCHLTIKLYTQA